MGVPDGGANPGADPGDLAGLTDYARLRLAFSELERRGYVAPFDYLWSLCCQSCGWGDVRSEVHEGCEVRGFVFTHMQARESAFPFTPDELFLNLPRDYQQELDREAQEILHDLMILEDPQDSWREPPVRQAVFRMWVEEQVLAEWLEADVNREALPALFGRAAERPGSPWGDLRSSLALYWEAPDLAQEIIRVLRAHGLRVEPPGSDETAIFVRPRADRRMVHRPRTALTQ